MIRLGTLIEKRALPFSVAKLRDIESGIKAVLQARYPNSVEADFQPIVEAIRDRAVDLLQSNDGRWPKGSKGNWYVSQLDQLMTTNLGLFATVLLRN